MEAGPHLSPQEGQTLVAFKQALGPMDFDDYTYVRFLKARKWNVEKTLLMFQNWLAWRMEIRIEEVRVFSFPEVNDVKLYYPHGFHKTDKLGRPIYIERIGALNLTRLWEVTNFERMELYFVREYERMIHERFTACSRAAGRRIEQSLTILDLGGAAMKLMSKKVYGFIKQISKIAQDNYPECLGNMFIVNTPLLFSGAWACVKPWLDKRTRDKISTHGSKFQKKLFELVDPDDVPQFLGGNCNCLQGCLLSDIGPWNPDGLPQNATGQLIAPEDLANIPTENPNPDQDSRSDESDEESKQNLDALKNALQGLSLPGGTASEVEQTPMNTQADDA